MSLITERGSEPQCGWTGAAPIGLLDLVTLASAALPCQDMELRDIPSTSSLGTFDTRWRNKCQPCGWGTRTHRGDAPDPGTDEPAHAVDHVKRAIQLAPDLVNLSMNSSVINFPLAVVPCAFFAMFSLHALCHPVDRVAANDLFGDAGPEDLVARPKLIPPSGVAFESI